MPTSRCHENHHYSPIELPPHLPLIPRHNMLSPTSRNGPSLPGQYATKDGCSVRGGRLHLLSRLCASLPRPHLPHLQYRFLICLLMMFCVFCGTSMRMDLGMAMVCMVNSSSLQSSRQHTAAVGGKEEQAGEGVMLVTRSNNASVTLFGRKDGG